VKHWEEVPHKRDCYIVLSTLSVGIVNILNKPFILRLITTNRITPGAKQYYSLYDVFFVLKNRLIVLRFVLANRQRICKNAIECNTCSGSIRVFHTFDCKINLKIIKIIIWFFKRCFCDNTLYPCLFKFVERASILFFHWNTMFTRVSHNLKFIIILNSKSN